MFGFFKKKKSSTEFEGKVTSLPNNDDALIAFKKEAQEGIQYLIDFMNSHEEGDELFRYAVKTKFIEDGNTEHMWVQASRFSNGSFSGILVNEPNTIKKLKYGDPAEVKRENVEDWILQDFLTNTKVGGFSSEYLRNKGK